MDAYLVALETEVERLTRIVRAAGVRPLPVDAQGAKPPPSCACHAQDARPCLPPLRLLGPHS